MSRQNQQFHLPDFRKLGFDEHGPSDGTPLFYFHGTPSARVEFNLFGNEAILQPFNIHCMAPDRPGIGLSDFQPDRRFMDWPKDVATLADHLKIDRFAILGYSGGGPYALACALAIPERITKVGVISGTGPFNQPGLADDIHIDSRRFMDLAHEKPWLSRLVLRMMGVMTRVAPKKVIANVSAALPEPDREIVLRPESRIVFLAMIQEALRQGPRGPQHETRLMTTEWDFCPQEIQLPVQLWHGEADKNAPIAMGRYMAEAIPNSRINYFPEEGHLSLFAKNAEAIFQFMVEPGR